MLRERAAWYPNPNEQGSLITRVWGVWAFVFSGQGSPQAGLRAETGDQALGRQLGIQAAFQFYDETLAYIQWRLQQCGTRRAGFPGQVRVGPSQVHRLSAKCSSWRSGGKGS